MNSWHIKLKQDCLNKKLFDSVAAPYVSQKMHCEVMEAFWNLCAPLNNLIEIFESK